MPRVYTKTPAIQRLLGRTEVSPSGCWVWTGAKDKLGYGRINVDGRIKLTHRVSYIFFKGEIEGGLDLDHLFRNPSCANPLHLEAVTRKVNTDRGLCAETHRKRKAKQTHCKRGHPLSGENLYTCPRGKRECKTCRKLAAEQHRRKHFG